MRDGTQATASRAWEETGATRGDARRSLQEYLLRAHVDPLLLDQQSREELVREHKERPLLPPSQPGARPQLHSRALSRILDHFHAASVDGKFALYRSRDYGAWGIARLTGVRGDAPVHVDPGPYHSRDEAEHAVFLLRVAEYVESRGEAREAGVPGA
ncbi:hypothetical protein IEZ26_06440 [Nocardioides cavernae]|uniref:N,N-dimethylformamidase alpha subunit domain-containing protein n=1 Tax=Nocardioides cavernae TaxID=1921566 RepID=A0ABR8N7X5_9ACTN|nr:hypothetical protein [Nocardioides cavernae]MBD3924253.1 hypothetical protein [Nocardioides cavernae]MBM7510808.1 hypothetical protein [Nocardioides cavernae]